MEKEEEKEIIMDKQSIEQRLDTLKGLKQNLTTSIQKDINILKQLGIEARSIPKKKLQKSNVNKQEELVRKQSYLKKRRKLADERFFESIKGQVEKVPLSNGSRFYQKLDVKVGIVADEFLYNSLKDTAEFYYINYKNYQKYTDILDVFIIVTTWNGLDKEWKGLGNPNIKKKRTEIAEIIKHYKDNNIKTIFYSKEDPVNYEIFIELAKQTDYIFTTASEKVEAYKEECNNENVQVFSFGVNPFYHNPVGRSQVPQQDVLFSGSWYDKYPQRIKDTHMMFRGIKNSTKGLKIIDRNYHLNLERHFFPEEYLSHVSPSVGHNDLQKVHKLYDWAVNFNSVQFSSTMFANRIYELQALGNLLISNYSLGVNNLFPNVFTVFNSFEVQEILDSMTTTDVLELQAAGIREVMTKHTSFHRMYELLDAINYSFNKPNRKIAVIVEKNNEKLIDTFEKQTYPNKTLFLTAEFNNQIKEQFDMIAFFDEENYYSQFYLEDMVNGFKYTNSSYITKSCFIENEKLIEGPEHQYVDIMGDRNRTVFWSSDYSYDELLKLDANSTLSNGYSIERIGFAEKYNRIEFNDADYTLSVIIPVYNNGKHLVGKCFNSLRRSTTFKDMEIILIDDGSTDHDTRNTVIELSEKYNNVKTYFFEDYGSGSASRPRNKGVELATSEYITFLDPDNEAINDGYTLLVNEINKNKSIEMVIGNMIKADTKVQDFDYYRTMTQFSGSDTIRQKDVNSYLQKTMFKAMSIQALVVKKSVITKNGLKMVEGAIGQDTLFFHELIVNSECTKVINVPIHIYYAGVSDSVTNTISSKFYKSYLLLEKERIRFLKSNNLLESYMDEKFSTYFEKWYLDKLDMINSREERQIAEKILSQIYLLYKDYITDKNNILLQFEENIKNNG